MDLLVLTTALLSSATSVAHEGGASESITHFLFSGHHGAIGLFLGIAALYAFVRRAIKRPDLPKPLDSIVQPD